MKTRTKILEVSALKGWACVSHILEPEQILNLIKISSLKMGKVTFPCDPNVVRCKGSQGPFIWSIIWCLCLLIVTEISAPAQQAPSLKSLLFTSIRVAPALLPPRPSTSPPWLQPSSSFTCTCGTHTLPSFPLSRQGNPLPRCGTAPSSLRRHSGQILLWATMELFCFVLCLVVSPRRFQDSFWVLYSLQQHF